MTDSANTTALRAKVQTCWDTARAVEPARDQVTAAQLEATRVAVAAAKAAHPDGIDGLTGLERRELDDALATAVARAAVVAIAAGALDTARAWLADAARLTADHDQRAELEAATGALERYRVLVHGRNRFAAGDVAAARAHWQALAADGPDDALRASATRELTTPRPYQGNTPELVRWNGCGGAFYGERDAAPDGSYITTYCVSLLFVPVFPLHAYRVLRDGRSFMVLSKEPLSRFARAARVGAVAAAALALVGYLAVSHLRDPDRLARGRFDAAISAAGRAGDVEAALHRLDAELDGPDLARVNDGRAQRAGAAVVRLTAGLVPAPFTAAQVDQVNRLVARYAALPSRARGGAARDALLDALEAWIEALAAPADRGAQLALLRQALTVADANDAFPATPAARTAALETRLTAVRLEVAAARATHLPLDALAVLVEAPHAQAATRAATEIVAGLVERPSLLDDAGPDLDAWLALTAADDPLRQRVEAQRALAVAARGEVEAEDLTPAQLAAMQAARPWDQRVAVRLASAELDAGAADAAEARLRGFGAPGLLTREARRVLAQIATARDQLDVADALLGDLLAARLPRFVAAVTALGEAVTAVETRLRAELDHATPRDLEAKAVAAGDDDAARQAVLEAWFGERIDRDATVAAARARYEAFDDVVPVAIASGTLKLRRAQALDGAARAAMLADAERTFLAIRIAAEGQPEFHLALGEIYARLGKHRESDAELDGLVAKRDPALTMAVARVYRNIGSDERATAIATEAYAALPSPDREAFASLLGVLRAGDDDASEAWFRKANPADPFVRTSLLEIAARRLAREGKLGACATAFADAAKAHLEGRADAASYNNAALAHQGRFRCSGDPAALADAQAALERAYRLAGDQPIVLANLLAVLDQRGRLRVLARHVDVRALRLDEQATGAVLDRLLGGRDRDRVLAEVRAEPLLRRSRELLRQYEVMAPNSDAPYRLAFAWADALRDEAGAASVVDRARHASALDTSGGREAFARYVRGEGRAERLAAADQALARLDAILATQLDDRTRAVALSLRADHLASRGIERGVAADLTAARAAQREADAAWPAQRDTLAAAAALIDELGLQADARRWAELRHSRGSFATLARLVATHDALADAVRGAAGWAELTAPVRADPGRPGMRVIWLAQLVDDPDIAALAAVARRDRFVHLGHELNALLVPNAPESGEALAVLDAP